MGTDNFYKRDEKKARFPRKKDSRKTVSP
jgi:hypothetical protein